MATPLYMPFQVSEILHTTESHVARLLRHTEPDKQLKTVTVLGTPFVTYDDLDNFVRRCAKNFKYEVTLAHLQLGIVTFLNGDEAEAEFGFTRRYLYDRVRHGKLEAFKFPGNRSTVLFCREGLERMAAKGGNPALVSLGDMQCIMGLHYDTIRRYLIVLGIQPTGTEDDMRSKNITRQQALMAVTPLLPPWVPALEWITARLGSKSQLLTRKEVEALVGGHRARKRLEAKELLWFIERPGGRGGMYHPETVTPHSKAARNAA